MNNSSYYIAPVGVRTHGLPHTVASNMVKVSHASSHSAAAYLQAHERSTSMLCWPLSALHIHHRCSMKMETMNVATSKSTLKHKLQVTIYECNYLISDTVIYYVSALIWGITCGCRANCVSKWTRSSTKLYDSQMSSSCFKGSPPT